MTTMISLRMDAIKKKMEKLANETNEAEMRFCLPSCIFVTFVLKKQTTILHRIAHFEDIKAANELEVFLN